MSSGIQEGNKTSSSVEIRNKMKKLGYRLLEDNRGLQVKQNIKCLKHKKIIRASPYALMNSKHSYECDECVKELIDKKSIRSVTNWKYPELINYALKKLARYPHKVTKLDIKKKCVTFICTQSNTIFTTSRLLPEQLQGKTDCIYCAKLKLEGRQEKIFSSLRAKNADINYTYGKKGKKCRIHGYLDKKQSRCYKCFPLKQNAHNKGLSIEDVRQRSIKNRKIKRQEELKWIEKATEILKKNYPKMEFIKIEAATRLQKTTVNWKITLKNNDIIYFNSKKLMLTSSISYEIGSLKFYDKDFLSDKGKTMPTRIATTEIFQRITQRFNKSITVLKYKTVIQLDSSGKGKKRLKLKLQHNCGNEWITYAHKLLQTKYGCPKCANSELRKSISEAHSPLLVFNEKLQERLPHLSAIRKFRLKSSEIKRAHRYGVVIRCSRCNNNHKLEIRKAKNLKACPTCNPKGYSSCKSRISHQWLLELQKLYDIEIEGCDTKERVIRSKTKTYRVDGFHQPTKTIFEFLGDYWHGNPKSPYFDSKRYSKTMERLIELNKVYNVIYVWEQDYYEGLPHSGILGHGPISFLFE